MALIQNFTGGELSINLTMAFTLIARSYYYQRSFYTWDMFLSSRQTSYLEN